jgi:hypothetical protein
VFLHVFLIRRKGLNILGKVDRATSVDNQRGRGTVIAGFKAKYFGSRIKLCFDSTKSRVIRTFGKIRKPSSYHACSNDVAGGSSHRRAKITLDTIPYLVRQLSRGQNRGKHCCSSQCQSIGLWWLRWTQEHKNHREDATIYPGSSQSVAYIQQLMILILKSTQIEGLEQGY